MRVTCPRCGAQTDLTVTGSPPERWAVIASEDEVQAKCEVLRGRFGEKLKLGPFDCPDLTRAMNEMVENLRRSS